MPPTGAQRAQQTAQDFNLDSRFGRNELVLPRVDPTARDEYALHHRAWGTGVRVADIETMGMKPHGDADVDVYVHVSWYRLEEQDLKSTTLKQSWRDKDGWELVAEERLDGDMGLLGEAVVFAAPPQSRPPARFPTVRLGGESAGAD